MKTMSAVLLCALVGVLSSSFSRPTSAAASFLLAPDPLNVTVGAVGEFFCRADADAVFWTVNDISVSQLADPNIYQSDGPVVDGFRTRILRIIADVQHSNSVIQCRSFTSGEGETPSDPVLLMVQGLLSAPSNVQAFRPSSSAIHLYWDPPFTLDITDVDPDIPGYTVSITNNNTKVTSERNVTKPEFLFQEEGYDPCHVYLFRVSAWNPVGVGEPSDIDECFGGAPQPPTVSWRMRESPVEKQITLHLMITYDMSCHGRRPESIDINIVLNGGSQMSMNLHSVPNKEWLHFHLDFSVDNAPCGIHVTVRNQFGSVDTNVTLEDVCQLRVTDDENSSENNLTIPIAVGICGAVIGVVILTVFLLIFIKYKGDHAKDQDTIKMKGNVAYEVHKLPHTRPQPVQLQPCAAYGVISSQ